MTQTVPLVGLLILPSRNDAAWRSAIGAVAREAGWLFTKPSEATLNARQKPTILLVNDVHAVAFDAVDAWAVIGSTPDQALVRSLQRKSTGLAEARRLTATRFAAAAAVVEQGGVRLDSEAETLMIPGLGPVSITPATGPVTAGAEPLAFYATTPPAAGARADWPTSVFSFTLGQAPVGGTPEIDLTGRGRILVHGPYFDLPKGWWRITVRFAVEPEDVAYLRFDWGAGQDVTSYHTELDRSGDYQLVLDHLWTKTGPSELRIWAERGHFLGRMTLYDCAVERLPDAEDL